MDLLRAIWTRAGYGELRAFKEGKVVQRFFRLPEPGVSAFNEVAADLDEQGWDVYYGILPRIRESGKAEDIEPWTDVVWADIDIKHTGSRIEAFRLLTQPSIPEPHFIVDSGNGFHAYWRVHRSDWDAAEEAMRNIAATCKGDHVYDRARILRVPGSRNQKDNQHPKAVRLLRFDEVREPYRLSIFPDRPVVTTFTARNWDDTSKGVGGGFPEWLGDLIKSGAEKGQRSEQCYRVAANLVRCGYSDGAIEDVFKYNPQGIGAKYAEKGKDGHRWLMTVLRAARAKT